jgi:hypothetical protein
LVFSRFSPEKVTISLLFQVKSLASHKIEKNHLKFSIYLAVAASYALLKDYPQRKNMSKKNQDCSFCGFFAF